jgi:hypothetical protein
VIKAIQTGGGLGPDGIVGPKTLDSLLTLDKSSAKPDAQVGGAAAASDDAGDGAPPQ